MSLLDASLNPGIFMTAMGVDLLRMRQMKVLQQKLEETRPSQMVEVGQSVEYLMIECGYSLEGLVHRGLVEFNTREMRFVEPPMCPIGPDANEPIHMHIYRTVCVLTLDCTEKGMVVARREQLERNLRRAPEVKRTRL